MAEFVKHTSCPNCGSSDNLAVYSDASYYCFSNCGYKSVSQEWLEENADTKSKPKFKIKSNYIEKESTLTTQKKKVISEEAKEHIKKYAGFKAGGFRSINDDVLKFYSCRTELDQDDTVKTRYYPVTKNDELCGYKVREVPKTFSAIGEVGSGTDLYGAFRFRQGGKYVLIVGGEEDCHAAYQMLKEYSNSKGNDFVPAVVSVTTGETSAQKQIAANYAFLNSFENILVGFDSDTAGDEGVQKIISSLPKGKVKIAKWSKGKDPNEILMKGQSRSFISDFYSAKTYVPAGVMGSDQLYDKIVEQSLLEKVPLPPFLKKLERLLGGGLALGHIYNIAAMTSIGKTAIVNEMIYHWIFNSPHMIGVVSMELNSGQYGETLLSRHVQVKMARMSTEQKTSFLAAASTRKAADELFIREDGSPRFFLVDDRDGTVEQIQDTIEQMIISSGVKIIVLDPLQDLIEGMSNEDQGLFMKWCKSIIRSHNVSIVLINHCRKKQNGNDDIKISESDIMGSSTIMKSATANIMLARDKEAEDPIERNTTYVTLPKSRLTGDTGAAGKIYYDPETHTMHDYDEYFKSKVEPVYHAEELQVQEPTLEVQQEPPKIDF